jgi:hypothetical protein
MVDMTFRGRVKVASMQFATTVMNEEPTVVAHNARLRWAQSMYQQPDAIAAQLQTPVVMDPAVQAAGADVTDAALQGATEAVINKLI